MSLTPILPGSKWVFILYRRHYDGIQGTSRKGHEGDRLFWPRSQLYKLRDEQSSGHRTSTGRRHCRLFRRLVNQRHKHWRASRGRSYTDLCTSSARDPAPASFAGVGCIQEGLPESRRDEVVFLTNRPLGIQLLGSSGRVSG